MREEAAARHVNRVDALRFEHLAHRNRVLEGVALGLAVEQRVVVFDGADLHLQVEVASDLLADLAHDLDDEAGAVLERTAVVVFAIVDGRAQELRDQVAVGAVQFDAVAPGLAGAPRSLAERLHDLPNLVDRCPLALEAVQRVILVGGAESLGVLDPGHVALPAAMAQLQDVLAVALAMHLFDEAFQNGVHSSRWIVA